VSIWDDIQALRRIVERIPIEQLRFMQENLVDLNAEVKELLGEDHGFYHGIGAVAGALGDHFTNTIAACREYEEAILDAADRLEQEGS
jgi:hypothetical protein